MALCDLADRATDPAEARAMFGKALGYERVALRRGNAGLPTGVLHRSAAWCAVNAGLPSEGVRLANEGLRLTGLSPSTARQLAEVRDAAQAAAARTVST